MNLFTMPHDCLAESESFERLHSTESVLIERIVSCGHRTAEGEWYDQAHDEWVALLQGEAVLAYEDGSETRMERGDWLLIPARRRHRVAFTSASPACVWLAVHMR